MNSYWHWLNEHIQLCELAKTTKSLETLEQLATSDDWTVRFLYRKILMQQKMYYYCCTLVKSLEN
jgi:hypothetical protein